MYKELKSEIKEIIEIVNQCPEALQEKCFEILLHNYINSSALSKKDISASSNPTEIKESFVEPATSEVDSCEEEIKEADFHIKVRKYLSSNGISISAINQLYYKEDGKLMPLYESLGSDQMVECQNRLVLLTAFENSFSNSGNEMIVNGETVRKRCQDMKCYDKTHFADTFKRYSAYFDNWNEKYDKTAQYSLSQEGKKALAGVLLDLAKEA